MSEVDEGTALEQAIAPERPSSPLHADVETTVLGSSAAGRSAKAARDLIDGLRLWELWGTLGWYDIRQRYRRSIIGPFWLTLSMGVMVGTIGFVYSGLFHQPMQDYLPFLSLGFIAWALLSGIILDACGVFTGAEGIIRQLRAPFSVHVFRMLWRNVIIFAHNIVIYVLVILLFNIQPGSAALLVIPGVILICLNGLWMGLLFGALSARFRDFFPIMSAIVQVFFFVTPIVWKPEQLLDNRAIIDWNPLYHLVEVVRMPLLGEIPALSTWLAAVGVTILGHAVTFAFFRRFRGRIAYWI